MRFGELLQRHTQPSWRYIDYERLKQHLYSSSSTKAFCELLLNEIAAVDACFEQLLQRLESGSDAPAAAALRTYAALNYLAVCKILKKGEKLRSTPRGLPQQLARLIDPLDTSEFSRHQRSAMTSTVERALFASSFFRALHSSSIFTHRNTRTAAPPAATEAALCAEVE